MISGKCLFDKGSCNGANVKLIYKGDIVSELTLQADGVFQFPGLTGNLYTVIVEIRKYNLKEVREMQPGQSLEIKLIN